MPSFRSTTCIVATFVVSALTCACSSQPDATAALDEQRSAAALFAPTTKRVIVEIDYARGAAPFVGPGTTWEDPWRIFRDNAGAIFGSETELVIPEGLDEMQELDDVNAPDYDEQDLVAIADKHRDTVSHGDSVSLYIVFLHGRFRDEDGSVLPQIAGVSVRGKRMIGMFKPAIIEGLVDPDTPLFMEQATLVHEFGHAVGLVDDGIALTSAHLDHHNGAHCSNPSCVMYWENVLVKDGVDFVSTYLQPRQNVLFGRECLSDVHAFASNDRMDK